MALLSRDLVFGGLRAIAKQLRRKQTSSNKRPRSPFASTRGPHVDNSRSSSSSSSSDSSPSYRSDNRRVFAEYDADGDGRISLHDLTRMVTAVGGSGLSEIDASAEAAAMEVTDLDRDGYIAFDAFQAFMTTTTTPNPSSHLGSPHANASVPPEDAPNNANSGTLPRRHAPCTSTYIPSGPEQQGWAWDAGDDDDDLRQAFAVYDHDGDGVITAHEILAVLRRVLDTTTTISLADCRRMVQAADRDGDGVVGFHDFAAMMMIR